MIASGLVWTGFLAGTAVIIAFTIGTLLGVVAAWWRRGWIDTYLPSTLVFVGAFPYFWLAMVALYILGFTLGWFPLGHAYGGDDPPSFRLSFIADVAAHAFLPVGTVVLATLGGWLLSMRNTMVAILGFGLREPRAGQGTAAAARSCSCATAARNAMLPSVTGFGMALGFVLGGSLLTEIVFSYPGQGYSARPGRPQPGLPAHAGDLPGDHVRGPRSQPGWWTWSTCWLDPRTRDAQS